MSRQACSRRVLALPTVSSAGLNCVSVALSAEAHTAAEVPTTTPCEGRCKAILPPRT